MASSALAARIRFLDAAARQLHHDAPAVAAVIGSSCLAHAESGAEASFTREHRDVYCLACGAHLVPNNYSTIDSMHNIPNRSDPRVTGLVYDQLPVQVLTCARCHRKTRRSVPVKHIVTARSIPSRLHASAQPHTDLSQTSQSGHTPSKKRSRPKKQSNLQALLAKSKINSGGQTSTGLNLMDFMKPT
ncbi:hypothetical protein FH972_022491 [Carpinus fangiana]|uniref:Uncharacterized protein n=1 Tax=Carpinus fangiana TaxID=176857 RepID=A0A5N6KSD8_9ROSI|nr:hypothetical protein FH972_022491 [Carpinus fangiana]